MEYEWIETTASVYRAIYESHKDQLVNFESYTHNDTIKNKLVAQITAWGFKDAHHPIIKSELRNYTEWTYSLLETALSEECDDETTKKTW